MSDLAAPADGRVLRGERTRSRIVEALLDLLNDGERSPTTAAIAARAGVSVRSVFQHFDDLEALYADLAREQARRVEPLLDRPAVAGSRDQRIAVLVARRSELYETIAAVRHAVAGRASDSPALRARLDELSAVLRAQLTEQFADELSDADDALVHAVDLVTSFEAWDRLRVDQRLDAGAAADVVATAVARLLPGGSHRGDPGDLAD